MKEKKIKITVSGSSGAGKTHIIAAIIESLECLGIPCEREGIIEESFVEISRIRDEIRSGNQPDFLAYLNATIEEEHAHLVAQFDPDTLLVHPDLLREVIDESNTPEYERFVDDCDLLK